MAPDWKPARTVRDPRARREFHRRGAAYGECAVCGVSTGLSLHHVYDRDDVTANFAFLCGDGTRGCHGLITHEDEATRRAFGMYVLEQRYDTIVYVLTKAGREAGIDWFRRRLLVDVEPALDTMGDRKMRGMT